MSTIILTGGGTAGHCIPNLALYPYLKSYFNSIQYIGSENGIEKEIISKTKIKYHTIPCVKLKRKICLSNLSIPFKLIKSVKKAGEILDKVKPNVIFSKGGYVALPVVIAANKRKIPIISHESDYTLGLSNRISSKFSTKTLTAFLDTSRTVKNGIHVGAPLLTNNKKVDINECLKTFQFEKDLPVLLITGGSQGAKAINVAVYSIIEKLTEKFNVIHICGKGNINNKKIKGYYQTEFLSDMNQAYAITSVCITRGGSNTLFELFSKKIPCLVIPLPKSQSRGDQIQNANYFVKLGYCDKLEQELLTSNSLLTAINSLYNNKDYYVDNLKRKPIKDESKLIAKMIADCLKT